MIKLALTSGTLPQIRFPNYKNSRLVQATLFHTLEFSSKSTHQPDVVDVSYELFLILRHGSAFFNCELLEG